MPEDAQATLPDAVQAARDAWVQRVLGVATGLTTPQPLVSQPLIPRPLIPRPATPLNAALHDAARRATLPLDDAQLPGALAALAPNFLAALLDEPETSAAALGVGAVLPMQDQMAQVAGLLDLLGRKLEDWSAVLDTAEHAKAWLGQADPASVDRDEYASTRTLYDDDRARGSAIEAEIAAMAKTIRAESAAISAAIGGSAS